MAEFHYNEGLISKIGEIVKEANEFIYIVSPYIKMHSRFRDELKAKKRNAEVRIVFVFGKNEDDRSKSLSKEDSDFIKEFPNIEIRYKKDLHAKYYANEEYAIVTSLNLHQYSQNNNDEAGVLFRRQSMIGELTNKISINEQEDVYRTSMEFFEKIINNSDLIFHNKPLFDDAFLHIGKKKYRGSKIVVDNLNSIFQQNYATTYGYNRSDNSNSLVNLIGYCIRTGDAIPFNPERPFSDEAYRSWSRYGNPEYRENFCHFSGEPSNGETSYANPIMRKNWKKAKEAHGF